MSQNRKRVINNNNLDSYNQDYEIALRKYAEFKEQKRYAEEYAYATSQLKLSPDEAHFYSFAAVALNYDEKGAKEYAQKFVETKNTAMKAHPELNEKEANMFAYGKLLEKNWSDEKLIHFSKAKENYKFNDSQAAKYADIRTQSGVSEIEARYQAKPSYSVWLQQNAQLLTIAALIVPPVALFILIAGAVKVNKNKMSMFKPVGINNSINNDTYPSTHQKKNN